jgi:predicted nucleotidyltransferase component of viral defense system
MLEHERGLGDDVFETKVIGIYSSEEKAAEAIARLKVEEGFRDFLDGFEVYSFELDDTQWEEGFKVA